ncbi:PAS domain-containing protein [Phenylobacterium sp.]|uniref:blue-light-activated histidine kinase n=1 Tax=Phenylobacterium sp. TaxID=1871053 RepID=UPI00374D742E
MSDVLDPSPALHSDGPAASSPQGLADRLQLAAIAVNRTRMPMVVTDPRQADNPIVLANQAFLDLTGYAADEVIGRNCRFLQGANTDPNVIAEIKAAIDEEREFTLEVLNYRKDGTAFWNQLHVSPIHDDDGRLLYHFASQDDVTEFRKVQVLEATERRLLKEVDHRARNVLAVVNGIVRLSRADDPKLYAEAIQQRVQALAAAHSLLAEKGWHEVALHEIIRQQLDALGSDRVRAEGPDVMVSAFVVQPLALVVHELLFNATIHGALSGPRGTLTVRWDEAPQPGGFELRWEEADGPAPPDARRNGFGTIMLRGMIEKQLRGQIDQEWTGNGLVITIKVPGSLDGLPDPLAA